jgi:DNA-binding transcriptional MocR family regulator
LAEGIYDLVDAGLLVDGTRLPAQRPLAEALGVGRNTVAAAFDILTQRGCLKTVQGSGSTVCGKNLHAAANWRFSTFGSEPQRVDFSSGALPPSSVALAVLEAGVDMQGCYSTTGYFPAGIPALRAAIAHRLALDGLPTLPSQILVTSGGQHALWLAIHYLVQPGDRVVAEEPTYRGILQVLQESEAHIESTPLEHGGLNVELTRRAIARGAKVMVCQTGIHNPTGASMPGSHRSALAELLAQTGTTAVEDCCSYDLTLQGPPRPMLAAEAEEGRVLTVGTLSKLFWGGLRIGWIRATEHQIQGLVEMRKVADLGSAVISQVHALALLDHAEAARAERQVWLSERYETTTDVLARYAPEWSWAPIVGGTGLWIDTGQDATRLAETAKRKGIKLAPGPSFSAHSGQQTMLRFPYGHPPEKVEELLNTIA